MSATTSLDLQLQRQGQWRLHPAFKNAPVADELLRHEFSQPADLQTIAFGKLRALLKHCYEHVPYYREQMQGLGLYRKHLQDPDTLSRLPLLDKQTLGAQRKALKAQTVMPGQRLAGQTRTSGTTGEPTLVDHSDLSLGMFNWLKQRELRWFGWDPALPLLAIRPAMELPQSPRGGPLEEGECLQLSAWPGIGELFATGKALAFSSINSIAAQLEVLERQRPAYLLMQASGLEHLAMQGITPDTLKQLRGALAISQTLTPKMRGQIESTLGVAVQQNYGLNEIGLVASRCPEGGRYHVHVEHCWVEIVKADGQLCQPGESGKILVTSLNNSVMPLLRYDADDMAEPAAGPCPCGRNLPAFINLVGRYRRTAFLPEGTWQRWAAIQFALYEFASQYPAALQKYQLQQDHLGDFCLRIDCREEHFEAISSVAMAAFEGACPDLPLPALELIRSREFVDARARKFQNFVSAFMPAEDQ